MNRIWFLWQICVIAIKAGLFYYLFHRTLGDKKRIQSLTGGILLFLTMFVLHVLMAPMMARVGVLFAVSICYSCFAFDKGWSMRILWGSAPAFIILVSDTAALWIASIFHFGALSDAWDASEVSFYVSVTSILLQVILVLLSANIRQQGDYYLSPLHLAILIGLSGLSIVAVNAQMKIVQALTYILDTTSMQQNAVFVCLCFLLILIASTILVHDLGKEAQQREEKSLEAKQAHLENEYYRNNEISVRALRELRHDITTHLHVMSRLMEEGKTTELREYFSHIESEYQKDSTLFLTENTMLNAMLTSKQMRAKSDNIDMRLTYTTRRTIPLSAVDFCSLVGNMIDNAIEACRKVHEEDSRYIEISVGDKGDMTFIKVKNSTNGEYKMLDGELQTTKTGARHGIGLKRVRRIAEAAGGFFDYNPRPKEFIAIVMVPSIGESRYDKTCNH